MARTTSSSFGSKLTISMWVNMAIAGAGIKTLISNSLSGPRQNGFRLFVNSDLSQDHKLVLETGDGANMNSASTLPAAIIPTQWTYIAVQIDRDSGRAELRIDGGARAVDMTIESDFQTTSAFEIGRMGDLFYFPGIIDEVEVASVIRPTEWIATAFANQRDPGSFFSVGVQEARP
jgi:Concanavalin A-like lectin/glucanases superfamily